MKFLRFFYNGLLAGMPSVIYNPCTKANIHVPFKVLPKSLYVNYKLNSFQKNIVQRYISDQNLDFNMEPIRLQENEDPAYYLSLNIYNCTSPVFLNDKETTRFEINTYVNDQCRKGTLIVDYLSNELSMDPVNIFKRLSSLKYKDGKILGKSKSQNIYLYTNLTIDVVNDEYYIIDDDLIDYSDNIFYTNGIYDKLFYDATLTRASLRIPQVHNLTFSFLNMTFNNPHSIFYFEDQIDFVGGVWYNIFKPPRATRCSVN